MQVYAFTLYVEPGPIVNAIKLASNSSDDAVAAAVLLAQGATRALVMRMVRSVTGEQFAAALDESLRPKMRQAQGDGSSKAS